ncbi:MAG: DUF2730 family protein [Alphaproteobacteria bacterium]
MKLPAALSKMGVDPARPKSPTDIKRQCQSYEDHKITVSPRYRSARERVELQRGHQVGAVRGKRHSYNSQTGAKRNTEFGAALGRYAVAAMLILIMVIVWAMPVQAEAGDRFGADRTAPLFWQRAPVEHVQLAMWQPTSPVNMPAYSPDIVPERVEALERSAGVPALSGAQPDTASETATVAADKMPFGMSELINLVAILAVIWIAMRTERLRRQADDTGRFRRLHERMDDHSRRLAAHETRLQGLPTHKDLARIDARLVAVEHTMQQIAHSVTRMEDFLINGISATAVEASHDA